MRAEVVVGLLLSGVAGAADLTVNAVPPFLQLGTQPEAQVVIAGPDDLSAVHVTVNHGSIAAVKQVGPGRFVADYRAPGQTFPRVAIITVVGSAKGARIHGWTTLPLWGSAEAVLQTMPNANVTVRIGDRTYGPIRADAKGVGKIPVVVPPGVQSGFYGAKVLDLGLPRVALTHLALDQSEIQADRPQTLSARFYAITDEGRPRAGLSLRARVTHGTITDFRAEGPGLYVAQWTVPETAPLDADLLVWTPSDPNSSTTARLRLLAGPPALVTLSVQPDQLVAGGKSEVKLTAQLTDSRGHPAVGALTFTTTLGAVGRAEHEKDGTWSANLRVPRGFGGAASIGVRAEAPGVPPAEAAIVLQPGPAQRIEVDPEQPSVVADGTSEVAVHVRLLDADRNPVEGRIEAAVQTGTLTGQGGSYSFRPDRSLVGGSTELVLTANGLSSQVPITLRAAPSRVTFAPKAGFASNFGNANAFAAALEVGFWLGENFGVGIEAGYLFVPRDSVVTSGPLAGSRVLIRAHGAPIHAAVSWRGRLASTLPVQATASGGVVVISSTLKLQDQQDVREVSVVPSAQLAASVGYSLGTWAPFVEVGVRWMGDAQGNNLTGSLVSIGVSAGCRFDLL